MATLKHVPQAQALSLVYKAIESGSLKLRGAVDANSIKSAREWALIDGTYLLTLLEHLTNPEQPKD